MKDLNTCNIQALETMISEARKISIVTHQKPDGDAMGSCIALYHFLKMCGKNSARIILNDRYPDFLNFLTTDIPREDMMFFQEMQETAEILIADSDLIFCLDFNAFHRTDRLEHALTASKARKVLIDHHLNPDRSAFDLVFSETEISSASELLYQILIHTGRISMDATSLPQMSAVALMTGMTTDTNNFGNSTYPSTFLMASDLLSAGVDREAILSQLYNQHSENRLRLMGHIMKDLLTITEDGTAYIVLDKEVQERYAIAEGDTEGFVNMPLSIASVRMSILAKEDDEKIRISIRSKKGTSANGCARAYFNGGGHENAAGGRLRIPEDVKGAAEAAEYIRRYTHLYFNPENENN